MKLSPPKPDEEDENELSMPATEKESFWKKNWNVIIASVAVVILLLVVALVFMNVTKNKNNQTEQQTETEPVQDEQEDENDSIDDSVRKHMPLRYHDPLFHPVARQRVSSRTAPSK